MSELCLGSIINLNDSNYLTEGSGVCHSDDP